MFPPPLTWPKCTTPLCWGVFARDLHTHPDPHFGAYIARGLRDGFRIGFSYEGSTLRPQGSNHPSSLANAGVVRTHIETEVAAGRLIGPISREANAHVHTSPIGLVPKGHTERKWRLIVDLSAPRSASVNNGILGELCSMKYASLDDAVSLIRQLGSGSQLVKMDLKDAYRMVSSLSRGPTSPCDFVGRPDLCRSSFTVRVEIGSKDFFCRG